MGRSRPRDKPGAVFLIEISEQSESPLRASGGVERVPLADPQGGPSPGGMECVFSTGLGNKYRRRGTITPTVISCPRAFYAPPHFTAPTLGEGPFSPPTEEGTEPGGGDLTGRMGAPGLLSQDSKPAGLTQGLTTPQTGRVPGGWAGGRAWLCCTHQVVLLVAHLRGVSAHAVDGQQQVQEGEGGVQP